MSRKCKIGGSMIKKCTCKHKAQDKLHGENMRVKNPIKTPHDKQEYRCTVCGSES